MSAREDYYRMSAEQCFLNSTCSCCTCRCCGLCILILWVLGGIIAASYSYQVLQWTSDGTYETVEPCYDTNNNDQYYDVCCAGTQDFFGQEATVYIHNVNCDQVDTVYTIGLVNGIR